MPIGLLEVTWAPVKSALFLICKTWNVSNLSKVRFRKSPFLKQRKEQGRMGSGGVGWGGLGGDGVGELEIVRCAASELETLSSVWLSLFYKNKIKKYSDRRPDPPTHPHTPPPESLMPPPPSPHQ